MKTRFSICLLLVSALSAQAGNPGAASTARPVARVNGAILTDRELRHEMYAIFPYAAQHGGAFPQAMEPQIRKGALKMIVFEELVYQEAVRRKLAVPAARMDKAWADFRKEFAKPEDFQRFLKTEVNGSVEIARTRIQRSLLIDEMMKLEIGDKAAVPVAEARAYYDRNRIAFLVPESFSVQTISMVPPAKATTAQMEEARRRAEKALIQAQATKTYEQFGLLAEKISEDDYRVVMGDHRSVERGKLPPPVARALSAMKPSEVSGVIAVDQTFTIVRLNAHSPAATRSFMEAKDQLRKQLEKDKTERLRSELDKRLRAKARIEEL